MNVNAGATWSTVADGNSGKRFRKKSLSRKLPAWRVRARRDNVRRAEELSSLCVAMTRSCTLDLVENGASYTLEEVATMLDVTRERVRQIEVDALVQIRRNVDEHPEVDKLNDMMRP